MNGHPMVELLELAYQAGVNITILPPPIEKWAIHVSARGLSNESVDSMTFQGYGLLDLINDAKKYIEAELEHKKETQG
jgi:hypothetical protein